MSRMFVCQLAYTPGPNKYDAIPGLRLTRETMPKHSIGQRIPARTHMLYYHSSMSDGYGSHYEFSMVLVTHSHDPA